MIVAQTVALSPHLDDLAFSVGGVLDEGRLGEILPVTVFSISAYTAAGDDDCAWVTKLRKEEDRSFFRTFVPKPVWLDRLDAPLRLGIAPEAVRRVPFGVEGEKEADEVAAQLLPLLPSGGDILAPLALGGHIDHQIVRRAALRFAAGRTLLFYEDLPYASQTREEEIEGAAKEIAAALGRTAEPLVLPSPAVERARRRAVASYRSQSDGETFAGLMFHPLRLAVNGIPAERIWKFAVSPSRRSL